MRKLVIQYLNKDGETTEEIFSGERLDISDIVIQHFLGVIEDEDVVGVVISEDKHAILTFERKKYYD